MKRFYSIFIALFWSVMMFFLLQREVLPNLVVDNPIGYKIELDRDQTSRDSWMGIYFKGNKIGFSNTIMMQHVENGIAGYKMNEVTLLRLNTLGHQNFVRLKGGSFFDEGYRLRSFYYKLVSGDYNVNVDGYVDRENIKLTIDIGGDKNQKVLKINNNNLMVNSISPMLLFKKLDVDKETSFQVFDPIRFSTSRVIVRNMGRETIEFDGVDYETYIYEIDMEGIKTRTWVRQNGDILKEESPLGFTMHKETAEKAADINSFLSSKSQDLALEFSISPETKILDPRKASYLKINKNGIVSEIMKDKTPDKEDILSIPIEDNIPEDDFIESNNKEIKRAAEKIVGSEKDSWIASKKILIWVYDNVKKTPILTIPSSLDVLHTMRGDCNEHTILFTALARSLGIPTKMMIGLVYLNGGFYYHAWPKVYVGKWISMDPTLGQEIADATHIPLLEGGIKEQLKLVDIIKNIKIEILEYR